MSGAKCTVELLYPEYGNQGGDNGNAMYLRACLPEAHFVETTVRDEPYFVRHDVDMVLMGSMTEAQQRRVIEHLAPHADRLAKLADDGVPMLFTGNAAEILGHSIKTPDGETIKCLGLLDLRTTQCMPKRFTCGFMGTFDPGDGYPPTEVIGFKIQFTRAAGANIGCEFARVTRGWGLAEGSSFEGFRRGGLIATWVLGPLLPTNPDVTAYLLRRALDADNVPLAYEDVARAAYEQRLAEFRKVPQGKDVVF